MWRDPRGRFCRAVSFCPARYSRRFLNIKAFHPNHSKAPVRGSLPRRFLPFANWFAACLCLNEEQILDSGYYAACAGLKTQTQALDVVANNLANINTNGYRRCHLTSRIIART